MVTISRGYLQQPGKYPTATVPKKLDFEEYWTVLGGSWTAHGLVGSYHRFSVEKAVTPQLYMMLM